MNNFKNTTVLIAEDDYLISEEIVRVLQKTGYVVIGKVPNGEQAIKMTQKLKPDVVLMDIQMPVMNGLEATKEIQRLCPTPVVILTAHETNDLVTQASKAGAGAYLIKPPKAIEIERYITIAIARHEELMKSNTLNIKLQKEISARKKIEKELKFFSEITTQATTATLTTDIKFKITWVNNAFEKLYGYNNKEILGKIPDFVSAEPLTEEISLEIYKTVSNGETFNEVILSKKKDGTVFHCGLKIFPLFDLQGEIFAYSSHLSDITKRIEAEEALKISEKKFRVIFEQSPIAIELFDNEGKLVDVNNKTLEMFGVPDKKYVIGFDLWEDPNFSLEMIEKLKNGKDIFTSIEFDFNIVKKNKLYPTNRTGINYMDMYAIPIKQNKKISGYLVQIMEVTDRKKAEEDLKNSIERFAILNKIIRHDLANDFMVIKSAINLYKRSSDETMISEMENRVVKSLKTIDDYRKYEQFINSNSDLKEIEVSECILKCIKGYSKIKYTVKGECLVFADDAISPVFTNLISNSIKHGKATKINIEISTKKDACEIRFIDNGSGIPDNIKFKIFQEGFYFGKSGNTGIGLHIVKKTVERYGGYIYAENNKPKGTVFVIGLRKSIESK